MESIHSFDFFRLHFDENGNLQQPGEFDQLRQRAAALPATDAIFLAHGFRNDENDALGLYTDFLGTFRDHLNGGSFPALSGKKFVVAGVFWPSKKFQESFESEGAAQALDEEIARKQQLKAQLEDLKATVATDGQKPKLDRAIQLLDQLRDSKTAQDEFVSCVLSLVSHADPDPTEGLDRVLSTDGSVLLDKLRSPLKISTTTGTSDDGGALAADPVVTSGDGDGGTQSVGSFFAPVLDRVGQFLNMTTWYAMKARCGTVGAAGVAKSVRDLKQALPGIRVHLVGHSLGGRLMASCAKSLGQQPTLHPDSLTLLEAAFSHFGFSSNNGEGKAGFFRSVVDNAVVKGPFIATFSAQDTVVGNVYAIASRLAGDNTEAIGDANDMFGGIGRNGAQKTSEAVSEKLHAVGTPYTFQPGKIQCFDGSNGLIRDHGDVKNPVVTYAFASAVAATVPA